METPATTIEDLAAKAEIVVREMENAHAGPADGDIGVDIDVMEHDVALAYRLVIEIRGLAS